MRSRLLWLFALSSLGFGQAASATLAVAPSEILQCSDLRLNPNVGSPGQAVVLQGISATFRDRGLEVNFQVPGRTQRYPSVLFDLVADRANLLVIVHPTEGLLGGRVDVVISSEGVACPALPFTIRPVQAAPGVLGQAARTFEAILVRELERWGAPTDGSPMPPGAPEVVDLLDWFLDDIRGGDGRPSLQESIAAAHPDGVGLGEVGAIYTGAGLMSALGDLDAGLAQIPALREPQGPSREPDWSPDWLTPEGLENLLLVQSFFDGQSSGRNKAFYDAAAQGFAAAGLLAALTGVGAPVAAGFGTAASVTGRMVILMELIAGILPASLDEMVLNGETVSFEEDHPEPEGRWTADLYASSKGYKLDITTIASLLPGISDIANIRAAFRGGAAPVLGLNTQFAEFALGYLNAMLGTARSATGAEGVFQIGSKVTGPVRIDARRDEALIQWQVSSRVFELDGSDPHIYRGLEAGVAVLVVRTRPGRFAGKSARSSMDLEVRPIYVTLFGPDGRTDISRIPPNQTVTIQAVVENALNPCLRWRALNGGSLTPPGECVIPEAGFGVTDPGLYGLEAESMSRTGIRASMTPRRSGGITLRAGGLQLIPSRVTCVEVGETVPFQVLKWDEPVGYSMMFEAQGGTITPDGQFTALTIGMGWVSVSDPEDPNLSDQASVEIKEECVGWRMTLTGSVTGIWEGLCPTFTSVDVIGNLMATFMPEDEILASPMSYLLFDHEGNQIFVMLPAPATLNRDGSPTRSQGIASMITLPFTFGIRPGLGGMIAIHGEGQPGLTVEHTWRTNPKGSSQLLRGRMSGVLYQDPDRRDTADGAPVGVDITFRGMGAAVGSYVAGLAPIEALDVLGSMRDPVRMVCTGPEEP